MYLTNPFHSLMAYVYAKKIIMRYFILFFFMLMITISCKKKKEDTSIPFTVTTDSVRSITDSTAIVYGTVRSEDYEGSVYQRGARWGLRESEYFLNVEYFTVDTLGTFSVDLTGLYPQTEYGVRAFIETPGNIYAAVGETLVFRTK